MQKLRNRLYSEQKGFTLIELLVVVLIIGILSAIALPAFLNQRTKAQDASARSDVRTAASVMESCGADVSNYSTCSGGAGTSTTGNTGNGYKVEKTSDSGLVVSITRATDGTFTRTGFPAAPTAPPTTP